MPPLNPLIYPLPYQKDSATLFAVIANQPWAIFLDSGFPYTHQGRYDIIASDPVTTLVTRDKETTIVSNGVTSVSQTDPFALLKQLLTHQHFQPIAGMPFNGGALGYFSYDFS